MKKWISAAAVLVLAMISCSGPQDLDYSGQSRGASLSGTELMTTFMPLNGQSHEIGQVSKSISIDWIKTWTVKSCSPAGSMLKTAPVSLPAGRYGGLFQIWHKQKPGVHLGELRAYAGENRIAVKPLISEKITDYSAGGYQRALIEFDLATPSENIVLELFYGGKNRYIWSGAVNITSITERRPFYNIAHRCSTMEKANDMVSRNANALECDITPELVNGKIEFKVFHSGDLSWTASNRFDEYLLNIKRHFDNQSIAFFMFDCKQVKGIAPADYAKELALRAIKAGLKAEHLAFSVPDDIAGVFHQVLKTPDAEGNILFNAGIDSYLMSYKGLTEATWVDQVEKIGATFIGVGEWEYSATPQRDWMSWIQAQTNRRDSGKNFKKAYFWTLNRAVSMRKCADYGVDGVITNYPERMHAVLNEAPYNLILREATQADSQFKVHGFE